MKLYLDDDSIAPALILALRRAGHDVRTPAEAGLSAAAPQYISAAPSGGAGGSSHAIRAILKTFISHFRH